MRGLFLEHMNLDRRGLDDLPSSIVRYAHDDEVELFGVEHRLHVGVAVDLEPVLLLAQDRVVLVADRDQLRHVRAQQARYMVLKCLLTEPDHSCSEFRSTSRPVSLGGERKSQQVTHVWFSLSRTLSLREREPWSTAE